ncbi:DUF748 domain-containing protein [Vibrio maerlii]|uniref:DUF748 domain-containing protein n=1 Tax=Vibrio maerlii TaxID=2231648 RepID=UPI000E3CB1E1|nr:DUF748 domain-containing protein [Vibrio maerlii]
MFGNLSLLWSRFQGLHRVYRLTVYAVLVYLFYALILGVVTPYTVKKVAPEKLTELLGRNVTIEDVRVNPFTLEVAIQGLRIQEQDQAKTFTGFEYLGTRVNFWRSILNAEINVEFAHLDGFEAHVARLSEQPAYFNFTDIIEHIEASASESAVEPEEEQKPVDRNQPIFPVSIASLQLNDAEFTFHDQVTDVTLSYPNINFLIGGLHTQYLLEQGGVTNRFKLAVNDIDNGTLQLEGQTQLKPFIVDANLDVQGIQLPRVWGFVDHMFQANLTSGFVGFSSDFSIVQSIGTTVEQDSLDIQTMNGQFNLSELSFSDESKAVVSLPELKILDIATNVTNQIVEIDEISAVGLAVDARLNKDKLDLVELFTPTLPPEVEPAPSDAQAPSSEEQKQPWLLQLGGVNFSDFGFDIQENAITKGFNHWSITPLNLKLGEFKSDLSKPLAFDFSTEVNQQGSILAKGEVDLISLDVEAQTEVQQLSLKQIQPFVATTVNATIKEGKLSTKTKVVRSGSGNVVASGNVTVDSLSVIDNRLKTPFVKWQQLALHQFKFDLNQQRLDIDTLKLDQPYARVIVNEDSTTNIGALVIANDSASKESAPKGNQQPDSQGFMLNVGKVEFAKGSAFFADNSLTPNFATGIELLEGSVSNISSKPGTMASVDVRGSVDKYAPVKIVGDVNPLLEKPYLDLDVSFDGIELTSVNPYSGTYAGRYIDRGQLTLALNYQLEDNQLKGSNRVVIDQLELGESSESDLATSLPLDLAIALLQDTDGVIDLGVDVSGDLNDPEFGIGTVIWKAITNIIEKAVTAPFSFIAGLAGSDEELNIVEFEFGSSELTDEQQEKLATLSKALIERPMLNLSVDGGVDEKADSQALVQVEFRALLADRAGLTLEQLEPTLSASSTPNSGPLSEALQSLYSEQSGQSATVLKQNIADEIAQKEQNIEEVELNKRWHIAMYNLVLNEQELKSGALGVLAQQRAQHVKAYLVEQQNIAASRIFLKDSRFDIETDASQVMLTLEP